MGNCISCRVSDGSKKQSVPEILPARPDSKDKNSVEISKDGTSGVDTDFLNNTIKNGEREDTFERASFTTLNGPVRPNSGRQKKLSICSTYSGRGHLEVPHGIPEDNILTIFDFYNIINDGSLNPYIHEEGNVLIVDCRDIEAYSKMHVVTAKHQDEVKGAAFQAGLGYSMFNLVIIYGTNLRYDRSKVLSSFWNEVSESFAGEVLILLESFASFEEQFPFMCREEPVRNVWERRRIITYPSVVINSKLFQGNGEQAKNKCILDDLKIKHIVNITKEHQNKFEGEVSYLRIAIEDEKGSNLSKYFENACEYIEKALKKKSAVLVHCNLGVSRSSTIVLAYLMKSQTLTLANAYTFLKSRRSCIRPNIGFLTQLSEWEFSILGKKVTDVYGL